MSTLPPPPGLVDKTSIDSAAPPPGDLQRATTAPPEVGRPQYDPMRLEGTKESMSTAWEVPQSLPYGPSGPAKIETSLGRSQSDTTHDPAWNVNSMSAMPMMDYASMDAGTLYAASVNLLNLAYGNLPMPMVNFDLGTSDPFPVVPPGNWSQAASAIAAAVPAEDVAGFADPPKPKTSAPRDEALQCTRDEDSGLCKIRWLVDASVLTKNQLQVPSPEFSLHLGEEVQFKLILEAKETEGRGGRSFKKANGKGVVLLKCMNPETHSDPRVAFTVSVESPSGHSQRAQPRGPVSHDFSKEGVVCGLPENDAVWHCMKVVDKETQRFAVCLEELPVEG